MQRWIAAIGAALSLMACASTNTPGTDGVYDPLEGWNRGVYGFNNVVDGAVLAPAAHGYRAVTNEPIRDGVSNVLSNLRQPVVFANTVLQGKPGAALGTVGRFLINTTFGIGGVFDIATPSGLPEHKEDFGQTLGVWGVDEGAYLMLPLFGPSNVRDAFGLGVDTALDPLTWAKFDGDTEVRIGRQVVGAVTVREELIEQIETLRDQPEPYIALRRNYTQQRQAAIRDGELDDDPFANLPEFDDYDFDDENEE